MPVKYSLLLCLAFIQLLSSCGVNDAERVADLYHEKFDAQDYQFIIDNLVDQDILAETGEAAWLDMFEYIDQTWGKIQSRKKETAFDSNYENGETSVQLNYTSEHALKPKLYERLYLLKKDADFKITGILVNETKEGLEKAAIGF